MDALKRIDTTIVAVTSWIVVYLTLQMTIVVLIGVFTRYVLNDALAWIEELARYTMIWLTWLGGGLALRRGAHLAVEFVIDRLPEHVRAAVVFVGRVAMFAFLAIVFWYGLQLTGRVSMQSTIALGISMQLPYSAIPVGAFLLGYHLLAVMFFPWAKTARPLTEVQV